MPPKLQSALEKMFPDSYVNVRYVGGLGGSLYITFAQGKKETWANGIFENDPMAMKLLVNLADNRGNDLPAGSPVYLGDSGMPVRALKRAGGSFRKISAKNLAELAKKIEAWFKKNHDAILSAKNPY